MTRVVIAIKWFRLVRTDLKTLEGLQFADKNKHKMASVKVIIAFSLKNNDSNFKLSINDLNNAQFDVIEMNPISPGKIKFSNGTATKAFELMQESGTLSRAGIENLRTLLSAGKDNFTGLLVSILK